MTWPFDTCCACGSALQAKEAALGNKVRVLLLYARSSVVPTTSRGGACAIDAIYQHERPEAGVNCPQQVYSALEDQVGIRMLTVQNVDGGALYCVGATCNRSCKPLLVVQFPPHTPNKHAQHKSMQPAAHSF